MNITITNRSPKLALLASKLSPGKRAELSQAMGLSVREVTRDHLIKLAGSRHATAERLGASPSGFLALAARSVEDTPIEVYDLSAVMTILHPGIGRAFHDVTIVPTAAKALAIPIAALAYNRRPRQFGNQLYVLKSKFTGNAFLAMRQEDRSAPPLLMYLLVRSVTQRQDRSLLPSQQEWERAAAKGALLYIQFSQS